MLTGLERQWVNWSLVECAGLEPPPGFPRLHPTVGPLCTPVFCLEKEDNIVCLAEFIDLR